MSPPRSWVDGGRPLVADASVWINIIAGGQATAILSALARPPILPRIVLGELERGRNKGRATAERMVELIEMGLVEVADLHSDAEATFISLVAGPITETLDDGEAATLAHAHQIGGTAMIDERKAIGLAVRRFPALPIVSSAELLLSPVTRGVLNEEQIAVMLHAALQNARMRVPNELLFEVCRILGPVRAADCTSLPAAMRSEAMLRLNQE
jgi:predicted nucleic acid-binding protein